MHTAYGRYLKKTKKIPSDSGRDALPPREFANLEWLQPHDFKIDYVETLRKNKPVDESPGSAEDEQEENDAFENDSMESLDRETSVECETEMENTSGRSSNDVEPESENQKPIKATGNHEACKVRKARKRRKTL